MINYEFNLMDALPITNVTQALTALRDLWENIDCSVCRTLLCLEELNLTTAHLESKTKVCRESRKTATSLSITVQNRSVYSSNRAVAPFRQDCSDGVTPYIGVDCATSWRQIGRDTSANCCLLHFPWLLL